MRSRWTAGLATVALVVLVGSGATAVNARAGEPGQKDYPSYNRGFSDWQLVTLPTATVPNGTTRTAPCPPGKKVLGGGAQASGANPILVSSFPVADGSGWSASGRSSTAADIGISVFAICAKVS
jgi:hypothetical protein